MKITLNTKKQLTQTANEYFEKAKKFRKKADGAREAVEKFTKQLAKLDKNQEQEEQKQEAQKKERAPQEWYEKFRWFISSEGFLCIGGRDATTNEIIVKKHADKNDLVFHTEAPGSPFFVIKTEGKKPGEATLQEVADATASFSRAWKLGMAATEAYSVNPDQLSRTAESGEYLTKGAFIVRGKRNYRAGTVKLAVGKLDDGRVMCAPPAAVKANCQENVTIQQGKDKPSDCAKKISKKLDAHVDDVLRVLPAGGCEVKK